MFKLILYAAVAGLIVLTVSQDASAGWRRRCRHCETTWYAPAPAVAPVPTASAAAPRAPAIAQSGSGTTYRSYSYDAGPAYQAPAPYVYRQPVREPSQSNFFRADRKMHGMSWYRNQ